MPSERFDFPNTAGYQLAGRLDTPAMPPRAYALFAHCFTCGKDARAARRIAEALTALGIAVLRFDFTGLGGSEGEFANTTFSSNVGDLVAAADHLRRSRMAPALLIGHSLGGCGGAGGGRGDSGGQGGGDDRRAMRPAPRHRHVSRASRCHPRARRD